MRVNDHNCFSLLEIRQKRNKPGPAHVGAISKAQTSKKTSKCQVSSFTVLENRKFFEKKKFRKNFFRKKISKQNLRKNYILKKMDRVASRGPLAQAPGALKSHNAKKTERGTLWGFSTSILSQNIKKLKGVKFFIFGKKSHSAKKNCKGGPFEIFQHPFCRKTSKKMQGDPLGKNFFRKKVSQCRKKLKGGPFGLARYGMLRGKTGKTFLVQFARPNSAIGCNNIL